MAEDNTQKEALILAVTQQLRTLLSERHRNKENNPLTVLIGEEDRQPTTATASTTTSFNSIPLDSNQVSEGSASPAAETIERAPLDRYVDLLKQLLSVPLSDESTKEGNAHSKLDNLISRFSSTDTGVKDYFLYRSAEMNKFTYAYIEKAALVFSQLSEEKQNKIALRIANLLIGNPFHRVRLQKNTPTLQQTENTDNIVKNTSEMPVPDSIVDILDEQSTPVAPEREDLKENKKAPKDRSEPQTVRQAVYREIKNLQKTQYFRLHDTIAMFSSEKDLNYYYYSFQHILDIFGVFEDKSVDQDLVYLLQFLFRQEDESGSALNLVKAWKTEYFSNKKPSSYTAEQTVHGFITTLTVAFLPVFEGNFAGNKKEIHARLTRLSEKYGVPLKLKTLPLLNPSAALVTEQPETAQENTAVAEEQPAITQGKTATPEVTYELNYAELPSAQTVWDDKKRTMAKKVAIAFAFCIGIGAGALTAAALVTLLPAMLPVVIAGLAIGLLVVSAMVNYKLYNHFLKPFLTRVGTEKAKDLLFSDGENGKEKGYLYFWKKRFNSKLDLTDKDKKDLSKRIIKHYLKRVGLILGGALFIILITTGALILALATFIAIASLAFFLFPVAPFVAIGIFIFAVVVASFTLIAHLPINIELLRDFPETMASFYNKLTALIDVPKDAEWRKLKMALKAALVTIVFTLVVMPVLLLIFLASALTTRNFATSTKLCFSLGEKALHIPAKLAGLFGKIVNLLTKFSFPSTMTMAIGGIVSSFSKMLSFISPQIGEEVNSAEKTEAEKTEAEKTQNKEDKPYANPYQSKLDTFLRVAGRAADVCSSLLLLAGNAIGNGLIAGAAVVHKPIVALVVIIAGSFASFGACVWGYLGNDKPPLFDKKPSPIKLISKQNTNFADQKSNEKSKVLEATQEQRSPAAFAMSLFAHKENKSYVLPDLASANTPVAA